MNSTGNWKSLVYVFNCMRSAKCGHFCQFKRIVQFNDCSMSFLRGVSLFFRANEPDFTVAISHMQWHATQVYSVERKKGYTLLHARRKKHHHQKLIDFEMFTRIQSWLECSQCSNEKQPIARLMLNIALSLHLIDEMFSVFMFRQLSIITLCVRTFWLYTRYAGYQSRLFLQMEIEFDF